MTSRHGRQAHQAGMAGRHLNLNKKKGGVIILFPTVRSANGTLMIAQLLREKN
jgi:hypothetical protein